MNIQFIFLELENGERIIGIVQSSITDYEEIIWAEWQLSEPLNIDPNSPILTMLNNAKNSLNWKRLH